MITNLFINNLAAWFTGSAFDSPNACSYRIRD